ncbi:MAG: hypothetical protein H7330_09675 [Hymenobacteraceae bacterium]|nr:hypothetical protein [Hymenobacteraceae bacterium]
MHFFVLRPLRWLLVVAAFLLSAGSLFAQAPAWQDAVSPGSGRGQSTAVDAAGNTYVTGSFTGTATFGATTLTSAGGGDIFVAKRTPGGVWEWATRAGGSGSEGGSDVAVDGSGGVVVTGASTSPTSTFGVTTLTGSGYGDIFVAKLTPTGAWLWATGAGGSGDEYGYSIVMDSSGSVVVTGGFSSPTIPFGATTLTNANAGSGDLFVAKLTSAGVWEWATRAGGSGFEGGIDVAVDGSDSVVVTGEFTGPTSTFGLTTLLNAGVTDAFVAKLTPAGAWQWAIRVGGSGRDAGLGLAVDGSGSVVVSGYFASPTIPFGATTLTGVGSADIFVAKLTPMGAWLWATGAGGSDFEGGQGVAVDGSGSVIVTGGFKSPTISFGATTLTSAGNEDMFVAKLTPAGAWQWATSAGGSGFDYGFGVGVNGSGSVMVTGTFDSPTIPFGATTLTNPSPGTPAIFLARLGGITGLPEGSDPAGLTLSPNPARTTVQLTGAPGATATLLDGLGRVVGTAPVSPAGTATLDVRALPAGLYLLRAGGATRRLVVE